MNWRIFVTVFGAMTVARLVGTYLSDPAEAAAWGALIGFWTLALAAHLPPWGTRR
jgi:hypothetical protein